MSVIVRPSAERGRAGQVGSTVAPRSPRGGGGGLAFGRLRGINEDRVEPSGGFQPPPATSKNT